ncbi:MAG: ribosome-associated translation inhibitor RaiA [Phycisphaeraceae bacterium]|nr:MAG: ribosome-associated translation inhibitor RaiA [Phycisphaeraceae bacterium]
MQFNISARHMDLTPAIEEYARRKGEKLLRHFDRIQQVDILIDKQKNGYKVEILTDVEHHQPFVASMTEHDLYACIDLTIDKSIRQLSDHKSRLRDNKHSHTSGSHPHEAA